MSLALRAALACAIAIAAIPAVASAATPSPSVPKSNFTSNPADIPLGQSIFTLPRPASQPATNAAAPVSINVAQPGSAVQPPAQPVNPPRSEQPAAAPPAQQPAAAPPPAQQPAVAPPPLKWPAALPGTDGYDISWPQCNDAPPAAQFNFAIIGVNNGKALTYNKCFKQQWDWANNGRVVPQAYINVNGMPADWGDWYCKGGDKNCYAYSYGRYSAVTALQYARQNGADPKKWWLDVEQENWWSPDLLQNAFVIRGAVEALQAAGKDVGVYSTPYQWSVIAGSYALHLDVWTAGADDRGDAIGRCQGDKYAFNGGRIIYVQYIWANFDTNFAC